MFFSRVRNIQTVTCPVEVQLVNCKLMLYGRWRQVRSWSHKNQSWHRNTVPPCTTTIVQIMSTRQRILLRVVWTWHPSTWATAWCNTISRALKELIKQAPATNFYLTPSSTIMCFDTASSSWTTFGECWISAYCNTIASQMQCRPKMRKSLNPCLSCRSETVWLSPSLFRNVVVYRVVQKTVPQFYLCDNFRKWTPILTIFSVRTGNIWRIKVKLCLPPHLYFVTALPSKTHTTQISTLHVWFIELLPINQSYVTVMLNKSPYTNNIAVFDMFTVILPNTFNFFHDHDAIRWSYTVNETLRYFFCSVIIAICSNFTLLNFHPW